MSTSTSRGRDAGRGGPSGKQNGPPPVTWMSLPNKPQLFILAICRLSDPLSNTCLLPYIYYLIRSLQTTPVTPASISRQAGLLVSLFALAQFATSMPWASIANRWGRKPSIVIGIILSIVSNVGFGFSTTVPAVMFWRTLAGVGNGNIGVMRTMTAEIVKEKKYQSRAFLLLPLVFNSGVVIGLALGGCLAEPIINLPWLFGPTGVWNFSGDPEGVAWMREYPFALPTLFNAVVMMTSLVIAVFGLEETLPGKTKSRDYGLVMGDAVKDFLKKSLFRKRESGYTAVGEDEDYEDAALNISEPEPPKIAAPPPSQTPGPRLSVFSRSIYTRKVLVTIISFGLLPLHNSAFMQIFPTYLSTPYAENPSNSVFVFNGGLGLASPTIGLFLSMFGIFGILIQLCIYPSLQAWLGTLRSYRVALAIFPLAYLLAPYLSLIPSSNYALQYLGVAFILFLQVTARTFGIPSSVILLTNSAPTTLALGAVHGAGNMLGSFCRAVGPLVGGVIFGWGEDMGVVGIVWWAYLMVIAGVGLAWSWTLKEGERPSDRGKYVELAVSPEEEVKKEDENENEKLHPR